MARCSPSAKESKSNWRSTVTRCGGRPTIVFSLGIGSIVPFSASGVSAHLFPLRQNRQLGSSEARGESRLIILPAGPAMPARIAAGLLAVLTLVSGCASRAFVFLEQDQSPAQFARDQAECTAEATENTGYSQAVGPGVGRMLVGSVAGALVGAGVGGLMGIWFAANASKDDVTPAEAGLIIAGSAGVGAVFGWFVGTYVEVKASVRQAQDLVDDAFQRCMEKRGYKVGRERA